MKRSIRSGFTLIELLVVIAIIAILAAILFPVFAQAKMAAKKAKAITQMKQVGTATVIYQGDHDDYLPPKVRWGFGPPTGGDPQPSMTWEKLIQPYCKNWEMLRSTEDSRPLYVTPGGRFRRGFSPASNLFTGVQIPASFGWTGKAPLSSSQVGAPSDTVMYGERRQRYYSTANSPADCVNDPWNHECWFWDVQLNNTRTTDLPLSDPRAPYGEVHNVYGGGAIWVFSDSSARWLKAGGRSNDGLVHGTILKGYEQKAAWWVGTPDPFWDQGVSCLDAGWNANDGQCKLPE